MGHTRETWRRTQIDEAQFKEESHLLLLEFERLLITIKRGYVSEDTAPGYAGLVFNKMQIDSLYERVRSLKREKRKSAAFK